jgi:carboxylesterase type B
MLVSNLGVHSAYRRSPQVAFYKALPAGFVLLYFTLPESPLLTMYSSVETVVTFSHCNSNSSIHHPDTIKCLRNIPYQSLVNASVPSYEVDGEHNLGMIWLPSVDGDFLPAAPSQLMNEGKFSNASFLIGWTDDDVPATDFNIHYDVDVFRYMRVFLAGIPEQDNTTVNDLLSLYPVGEFGSPEALPIGNLSSQYYRTSRILRDAVTVCPSLYLAEALNKYSTKPNRTELHDVPVFLYHFNYTILEPALQKIHDLPYYGVTTFAEISFVFNNLNKYQEAGYASNFTEVDTDLAKRTTLSWSAYAMAGSPSLRNTGTLQAWAYAYAKNETFEASTLPGVIEDWLNNTAIYVLGGPREGISAIDGEWSYEGLRVQKLRERCAFLNSDKWIKYLQY